MSCQLKLAHFIILCRNISSDLLIIYIFHYNSQFVHVTIFTTLKLIGGFSMNENEVILSSDESIDNVIVDEESAIAESEIAEDAAIED